MTALTVPWGSGSFERVLVYGLGLSGKAAARFLLRRGVAVVGVDRRPLESLDLSDLAGAPGLEVLAGRELETVPPGIDGVVTSPGVPPEKPLLAAAERAGLPVLAEVELAFPFLPGPVVAITGSNGKSTTTALAGALLRAAGHRVEVCGNIGTPLISCVDGPADRLFVVELSSFQLEGTDTFRPHAAALLNISPDHLDRHGSLDSYAAAKRRLFVRQGTNDVAVLNADDPLVAATVANAHRRFFSVLNRVADGCCLDGDAVVETRPGAGRELFRRTDVPLAGTHNLENAMAAALLAVALGAEPEHLRAGLRGFHGLPHRMERVLEVRGVTWYDDSKGTNVGATAKSLEGFADASVHLILGGRNKGADLRELRDVVRRKAARLYFIGESADAFRTALADLVPSEVSGTMAAAVKSMAEQAHPGDAAVLSPACASFDQFRDFNDRGEHFQRLVRAVTASGARVH
ncbi:MAG: UDP-N-acetylmuramoyl-L-alanine--D-glutamate ligase [Acidobacteriota bacterium]